MNMVLIDLLLIACIVVFIVDISGFVDSVKSGIKYVLTKGKISNSNYRIKPFDCSLCMTFWTGLIYLYITKNFTIEYIAYVTLLAAISDIIKSYILLVKDLLIYLSRIIYKLID